MVAMDVVIDGERAIPMGAATEAPVVRRELLLEIDLLADARGALRRLAEALRDEVERRWARERRKRKGRRSASAGVAAVECS